MCWRDAGEVRERRPLRGREQRVHAIARWLGPGGPRLITVTGLPGVGKTRLVRTVLDATPAGHRLPRHTVLLGPRPADESLLPSTVARAVADAFPDGGSVDDLLVVIDDVEPRPSTCEAVSRLLAELPGVRVLITARAPLHLPDEQVVRLDPLPSPSSAAGADELADDPAVQLFCDVASATGATVEADSLPDVAAICRLLGGHPLAIELAAGRSSTLSPATLHHLLRRRNAVEVLAGDPERDLFGALTWSEGLLSPTQRSLLHQLAVFHRPVPLSAVEAVAPGDRVLEDLAALVDAQLVEADHDTETTTRFSLHPLIREHARRALGDEWDAVSERHRAWATTVAEGQITRRVQRAGDVAAADVEADLVGALHRSLRMDDGPAAAALVLALLPIWSRDGMSERRLNLLDATIDAARRGGTDPGVLARLLGHLALIRCEHLATPADGRALERALDEAVALARRGDRRDLLAVLRLAVQAARLLGNWADTAARCEEGIELARALGDEHSVTRFEIWAGMVAHQQGRPEDAADLASAALHRARQLDDERLIATADGLLRSLPARVRPEAARSEPGGLDGARRAADRNALRWLAPLAAGEALARGDVAGAAAANIELAEMARDAGAWDWCELAVMGLARVAEVRGADETAARLHGLVAHHLPVLRNTMPPGAFAAYEDAIARVRDHLGAAAFGHAVAAAVGASPAEMFALVIDYGRSVSTPPPTPPISGAPALTAREREVLEHLVAGDTNHELAEHLGITAKTAMHHTSSIYRKLGVRGRPDAVAWAVRHEG
jgi:predicted ATPase/DNA-binding CsgD family transcriptional regulator